MDRHLFDLPVGLICRSYALKLRLYAARRSPQFVGWAKRSVPTVTSSALDGGHGASAPLPTTYRHGSTMILVCASGLARSANAFATPSMPTLAVTIDAASTCPSAIRRSEYANSSG